MTPALRCLSAGARSDVRSCGIGLVLALGLLLTGAAEAGSREDGYAALAAGRHEEAAKLLGAARVENPGDTTLGNALGTALYRSGRYREAEQIFNSIAVAEVDPGSSSRARYNAGNAAYRGGRLNEALRAYQDAMGADANFLDAQKNATAVEKEIAARKRPPPPEQQEEDQEEEQQNEQGDEKQPGQQGEDAQKGDPQAGDPGDPQPDGAEQSPGDGQSAPPGDGTRQAEAKSGAGEPGEATGDLPGEPGTEQTAGAQAAEPADEAAAVGAEGEGEGGDMTPQRASALVESVTEGKPRVVVGQPAGGKDW